MSERVLWDVHGSAKTVVIQLRDEPLRPATESVERSTSMAQLTEHNAGGSVVNGLTVTGHTFLRRLVLLGTPLALAVLEIFHPHPAGVSEAVEQGGWFMWFHFIQLPLIGLIVLAVYLLTEGLEGRAVRVSRWSTGVFAVFFSAYDAAAGIATGFALRSA